MLIRQFWITVITAFVMRESSAQFETAGCSREIMENGKSCLLKIGLESDLLHDHFGGTGDKAEFCSSELEPCVQAVLTASNNKCRDVNFTDPTFHAQLNALRGFCQDIAAWESFQPCVYQQMDGPLRACRENYIKAKAIFTRNQFDKNVYKTEFQRRNAHCRLIRDHQECNEGAISAYCSQYADYFRDYQVALLLPYCRQLFQITSRYSTDDPSTASSSVANVIILVSVALGILVKRLLALS